jgi:hypothetical protein
LGIEAAKASVSAMKFDESFKKSVEDAGGSWNKLLSDPTKTFEQNQQTVLNGFTSLFEAIENGSI